MYQYVTVIKNRSYFEYIFILKQLIQSETGNVMKGYDIRQESKIGEFFNMLNFTWIGICFRESIHFLLLLKINRVKGDKSRVKR